MITLPVVQGSPEWHAARSAPGVRTASDAPAMMGVSKYKTRADLLREKATGIVPEVNAATQELFDAGHDTEAKARPLAEAIIGDQLYPVTVTTDDGKFLASLDGVTMLGDTIFEHKLWNESLAADVRAGFVPESHRWQIDHQFLVHDEAERCIFVVSDGTPDRCVHCFVFRDKERIARLREGWSQFDMDLCEWKDTPEVAKPVAAPVQGFGVLSLQIEGRVLASNLDAFKAGADAFIARLPKPADLQSDQDFADAESAVKACAKAEEMIGAAKEMAQAQVADIDAIFRTADQIAATIRAARLSLSKVVEAEKSNRRMELLAAGMDRVRAHYATINESLGQYALHPNPALQTELGASIKGLKSLDSIRERIDKVVSAAMITASLGAEVMRTKIAIVDANREHAHLFPDFVRLCIDKSPEDLRNVIAARIAEHKAREEAKIEAERQRIRAEERQRAELQRIEREQEAQRLELAASEAESSHSAFASAIQESACAVVADAIIEVGHEAQRAIGGPTVYAPSAVIKLGDINAAIAPLSITADGLASLGFQPVGEHRAAIVYDAERLQGILRLLSIRLAQAANRLEAV